MKFLNVQLMVTSMAIFVLSVPSSGDEVRKGNFEGFDAQGRPKVIKPPVGKRTTAEDLAEKRRKLEGNRQFLRVKNEEIEKGKSIYDNSVILAAGGVHTIVPEGAVAYVPDHHSSKILEKPAGDFVLWPEFYRANSAWIRTLEVTVDQAKGMEPLKEQRIKALRSSGVVVVTLYLEHPVSFRGAFEIPEKDRP